ncbi:hypothetical protein pb186bvf_018279 [Paramecium bursaria]
MCFLRHNRYIQLASKFYSLLKLSSVQNDQFVPLDMTINKQFITIQMNSVNLTIEDGLILQNKNQLSYIDSVSITSQQTSKSINMKIYGFDYCLCFILRLSPIVQQVSLRYSNLGEIFAMVGSIASALMGLGILVEQINSYYKDNLLIQLILEQYFAKKVEINKMGQIKNIKGLQDLNKIKSLQQIAEKMFLTQKFGRNEIIQANDFIIQTNQFEESVEMNSRESFQFFIEDMNLLTYTQT